MRLGTCIALELAVVAGAVGGAWLGVTRARHLASDYLVAGEAEASTAPGPGLELRPTPTALPQARLPAPRLAAEPDAPITVFGAADEQLLAPLGAAAITRVKHNRGGTSLSLRLDFANGARAAFKPEQTWPQSDPRREIAAYRIDRLLGIGRVPPAKPAAFAVADLIAAADPSARAYTAQRLADEGVARGAVLHGELSWWVPEIKLARLGGLRIDEPEGRMRWAGELQVGAKLEPAHRAMLEQIAACILFDVLIDNADRWTGSNTEMSPDGQILYFMDNTLAFSLAKIGHPGNLDALHRVQVFPRRLVGRLRGLTRAAVVEALGDGGALGPLLHPDEISAILARRDHLIAYIDQLIAKHGEAAVLAFP